MVNSHRLQIAFGRIVTTVQRLLVAVKCKLYKFAVGIFRIDLPLQVNGERNKLLSKFCHFHHSATAEIYFEQRAHAAGLTQGIHNTILVVIRHIIEGLFAGSIGNFRKRTRSEVVQSKGQGSGIITRLHTRLHIILLTRKCAGTNTIVVGSQNLEL